MSSVPSGADPATVAFERLRQAEVAAGELHISEVPRFMGELERMRATLLLRATAAAAEGPRPTDSAKPGPVTEDRILTAVEVGRKLGRSRWWVYDHAEELPRVLLPGGKLGFSERQFHNWIEKRKAAGLDPRQELLRRRIRESGR